MRSLVGDNRISVRVKNCPAREKVATKRSVLSGSDAKEGMPPLPVCNLEDVSTDRSLSDSSETASLTPY